MRNGWRRVVEDLFVLGALAFLIASNFDKTEIQMITAFGAYLAGRALTETMPRKTLGYSWPEIAAASVLVLCVTVKCGHDLAGRYWIERVTADWNADIDRHFASIEESYR